MKTKSLFFFFLLSFVTFGQNTVTNQDEILFERTSAIESLSGELCLGCRGNKTELNKKDSLRIEYGTKLEIQICEIAIENYAKLIDSFPKSKFVFKALMRKADNELYLKEYSEAKNTYEKILKSAELNPSSENFYDVQEAYFKNSSALNLAEIYILEKNYAKAIIYLNESEKYKVKYICGNGYIKRSENLKRLYSICETELKKTNK